MSNELGYAEAHDTSIEERYRPAPLLAGKVIVISGIGPGLGRSLAVEAAKMGADLVLASRTEARLEELAKEVAEYGVRAVTVVTDVTDEDSRANLRDKTLEAFGRVDCVINNAFAIPPMDPITQIDPKKLARVNETNVFAPLRLSALFADALSESKGSIIMPATDSNGTYSSSWCSIPGGIRKRLSSGPGSPPSSLTSSG